MPKEKYQRYSPFTALHGVGVIIINPEATHLLVVNEIGSNPQSQRQDGATSIPMETVKINPLGFRERLRRTILGALSEVTDDAFLQGSRKQFHRLRLPGKTTIALGEKPVLANVEVIVFDGNIAQYQLNPIASDEVYGPRWVPIDAFMNDATARPWAKDIVLFAKDQGYLDPQQMRRYKQRVTFPRRLQSLHYFYHRREANEDLSLESYRLRPHRKRRN